MFNSETEYLTLADIIRIELESEPSGFLENRLKASIKEYLSRKFSEVCLTASEDHMTALGALYFNIVRGL